MLWFLHLYQEPDLICNFSIMKQKKCGADNLYKVVSKIWEKKLERIFCSDTYI